MSTNYGARKFSGRGLQVFLDAKNPASYPGSGETWYDLSGNARHTDRGGSVKPEWNSNGYFIFTGGTNGNNYTRFDIPVPTVYELSFFIIFRSSQTGSRIARMSTDKFNLTLYTNGVAGGAGNDYQEAYAQYTDSGRNVGWHHLGITFDGKLTRLYYDGIHRSSNWIYGNWDRTITGGSLRLGTRNDAYSEHYIGDISMVQIHDVPLTAKEVKANYEIFRKGGYYEST